MHLLYSIMLVSWGILLIPALLYRAWRRKKTVPGLAERFGRLPAALKSDRRPTVWFHACSVGETLSLQPLVEALHARFPGSRFVFSTITKTGRLMAVQHFAKYGNTFYFPVDLAFVCRRVLDWINPGLIVIVDTEIWPNLVHQAFIRKIPVALVNGRISASSFRYYRLARPALRRVFRNYELLMMQSEEDAGRIRAMGAPEEKIRVTGNIKFEKSLAEPAENDAVGPADGFYPAPDVPLIVAGSTHPGEEQVLLDALRRIRQTPGLESTRLLLAPRHPERFEEAAALILNNRFSLAKKTVGQAPGADVLLLDTLGELAGAYRFATVAFVGGTLNGHGGHSILEPALYGKSIVVGPSMENFRDVMELFRRGGAIRQIEAGPKDRAGQVEQLSGVFISLLRDPRERDALGDAALETLRKNRGACRLTVEALSAIFERANRAVRNESRRAAE